MKHAMHSISEFAKRYPIFTLFIVSYSVVHLVFEFNFWFPTGELVLGKYAVPSDGNALLIAQRVYFAKATWMFVFIWLLLWRLPLRAALTYSFLLYSVELLVFFELRPYLILNLLLAAGLLLEWRLKPQPRRPTAHESGA
jgi:hypothetical protein